MGVFYSCAGIALDSRQCRTKKITPSTPQAGAGRNDTLRPRPRNLDTPGAYGITSLHVVTWSNQCDAVRWLAALTSAIDAADFAGQTALHRAACTGCVPCLDVLLEYGTNPDIADKSGTTPAMLAVERGHTEAVRTLLASGCDPDSANIHGDTAIHVAVRCRELNCISVLLEHGADPDRCNHDGCTALSLIVNQYREDPFTLQIVHQLISANCDLGKPCKAGLPDRNPDASRTPMDTSLLVGNLLTATMLYSAGAEVKSCYSGLSSLAQRLVHLWRTDIRSLADLSALKIRKMLPGTALKNLSSLPIPISLQEYIQMKNLRADTEAYLAQAILEAQDTLPH